MYSAFSFWAMLHKDLCHLLPRVAVEFNLEKSEICSSRISGIRKSPGKEGNICFSSNHK
jgi:hypothetical protein